MACKKKTKRTKEAPRNSKEINEKREGFLFFFQGHETKYSNSIDGKHMSKYGCSIVRTTEIVTIREVSFISVRSSQNSIGSHKNTSTSLEITDQGSCRQSLQFAGILVISFLFSGVLKKSERTKLAKRNYARDCAYVEECSTFLEPVIFPVLPSPSVIPW